MGLKWDSNGAQMGLKWGSNGAQMGLKWGSNGVQTGFKCGSNWVQMGTNGLKWPLLCSRGLKNGQNKHFSNFDFKKIIKNFEI